MHRFERCFGKVFLMRKRGHRVDLCDRPTMIVHKQRECGQEIPLRSGERLGWTVCRLFRTTSRKMSRKGSVLRSTTAIESQRVRWRKRMKRRTRDRHSLSYDTFLERFPFRRIHFYGWAVRSITLVLGHTCEPLQRLFTPSLFRVRYNRESEFLGIIYRCERDCEKIGWSVLG